MASAVYPDDPRPAWVFNGAQEFYTDVVKFRGGPEQRRSMSRFPEFNFTLNYQQMRTTDLNTFWKFYRERRGAGEDFWYLDHLGRFELTMWYELLVAVADGVKTTFDIPGILSANNIFTLYINGIEEPFGLGYTISYGTGAAGADQVVLNSTPSQGAFLTIDFEGRLRARVRFLEDNLPYEWFAAALFNQGIELKGLSPNVEY